LSKLSSNQTRNEEEVMFCNRRTEYYAKLFSAFPYVICVFVVFKKKKSEVLMLWWQYGELYFALLVRTVTNNNKKIC